MKLTKWQIKALELLIDKYERSKQYTEGGAAKRAIMIKPEAVYKDYDSDFADVDEQSDFESEMLALISGSLIYLHNRGPVISGIELQTEEVSRVYEILNREPLKDTIQKQISFYKSKIGKTLLVDKFCTQQIELLESGKKAKYDISVAENLIRLLEFVLSNNEAVLERELSIAVFGDTKLFENEYRTKLVSVLKTYGDYEELISGLDDEKEIMHAILEEVNVYSNPKYVFFKGNGEITFENGQKYVLTTNVPMALPMDKLRLIETFKVVDSCIMTVENLASYNRINPIDCFCIFLAGYHNSARQRLIKTIFAQNGDKQWKHFGDIDPDGFLIFENLRRKTAIDFLPEKMGIEQLQKYSAYTKELQPNDIKKAKNLIDKGLFVDEMQYILQKNIKLEQEVISWIEK